MRHRKKLQKHFIQDDVLELFMHSNKLGGALCDLLYMSFSLYPRAASCGIIEQRDTCLIVFLRNATDPIQTCVCSVPMCVSLCGEKVTCFTASEDKTAATRLSPNRPTTLHSRLNFKIWVKRVIKADNVCISTETDALTPVGEDA